MKGIHTAVIIAFFLLSTPFSIGDPDGGSGEPFGSRDTAPSRGSAYINEDTQYLTIGNDHLEITLDKNVNCGISSIIDKETGIDLRGNKVPPPVILMLRYWTGSATDIVIQWDADEMTTDIDVLPGHVTLTIDYTGFRSNNLNATVTIDLKDDSRYADFKLDIENDEDFIVRSLFFPLVWGLGNIGDSGADDKVFYPVGDGLLLTDPLKYKDDLHMSEIYPSTASMQMMCHYDEDEAGLYMMTDDALGNPKKVTFDSMEWSAKTHIAMFFEHLIPEFSGNDYSMGYNCRVGSFQGDWYDAANIYRDWASTTDFVSGGKVFEDKDTPDWWSSTSVVSSSNRDAHIVHNSLSKIEEMTEQFNELTGVNTTHLIFAWAEKGAWCGPYYFPPAAGEENFKNSMNNITDMGSHSFIYISGSVWRITRDDIGYADYETFNDIGSQWVCLDNYGNPTIDQGYLAINWTSARMCPMTDFWHDMVVDNTLSCLDLGVDVVQIDEFPIGSIYPCYNSSHGHSLGYSNEIPLSYREILDDARSLGRVKNPDLIMSMEEPCEFYIPYMDTYVSRDNSPEFLIYPIAVDIYGDDVEFVPFFSHVYHEYITSFGEPIPMNINYPELFINQMKRSLARSFIAGEIVSGSADEKENLRPEVLDLYNTTVRASAGYCNEYMIRGKPLRPPEIDVPNTSVDWYFYSNQSIGEPFNESTVLHSSWEADNGDIGHVFLNWIDENVEFDVEINGYDLPNDNYSLVITRNGIRSILERQTKLPYDLTLNISPGEIVLIEATQIPDIELDEIQIDSGGGKLLVNKTYAVTSRVINTGTADSGGFQINLLANGSIVKSINSPGLVKGGEYPLSFNWDTHNLTGELNLSIICDPVDNIMELDGSNNERWITLEVHERPRSTLRVQVYDPGIGSGIEDAEVVLTRSGEITSITNSSNTFGWTLFTELIAGNYTIVCSKDHFQTNITEIEISEGSELNITIDLAWIEYPTIAGTIVDNGTGSPIVGAEVILWRINGNESNIYFSNITSNTGEFIFLDIDPDLNWRIEVTSRGYHPFYMDLDLEGGSVELKIQMVKLPTDPEPLIPGWIEGSVVDNSTDSALEDVEISVYPAGLLIMVNNTGSFLISDLLPGIYELTFSREGYIDTIITVDVMENQTSNINVRMNKETDEEPELHTIEGIVIDEFGEPIEGAEVFIQELDGSGFTDEQGKFIFEEVIPGNYKLRIEADGYTTKDMDVPSGSEDLTIILEKIKGEEEESDPGISLIIVIAVIVTLLILGIIFIIGTKSKSSMGEE